MRKYLMERTIERTIGILTFLRTDVQLSKENKQNPQEEIQMSSLWNLHLLSQQYQTLSHLSRCQNLNRNDLTQQQMLGEDSATSCPRPSAPFSGFGMQSLLGEDGSSTAPAAMGTRSHCRWSPGALDCPGMVRTPSQHASKIQLFSVVF